MKKEPLPTVDPTTFQSLSITKSTTSITDKLKIMVGMSTDVKQIKLLTIEDELALFSHTIQSYESDFSSFWIQNPARFARLYRVAQQVNIIAATSVPSESIFSIAGIIARKQRTSLSSASLRYLMILEENYRLDAL